MKASTKKLLGEIQGKLQEMAEKLDATAEAEQEYMDERSDRWQESEAALALEEAIGAIETFSATLSNTADEISELVEE